MAYNCDDFTKLGQTMVAVAVTYLIGVKKASDISANAIALGAGVDGIEFENYGTADITVTIGGVAFLAKAGKSYEIWFATSTTSITLSANAANFQVFLKQVGDLVS